MPQTQPQNVPVVDVSGYDVITTALMTLVNEFPGLAQGDAIAFSTLDAEKGKAFFPTAEGAIIERERKDILGNVEQYCVYPFLIVYRSGATSATRKAAIKQWLDQLGQWLNKQEIKIGETSYQLAAYPTLTGTRQFTTIDQQNPVAIYATNENATEDWALFCNARYTNKFSRG